MTNEEIVRSIKEGAEDSGELMLQLWTKNQALILKTIKPYMYYAEPDDLKQEAFLALYPAVEHYDPEAGTAFSTHVAGWIRNGLKAYLDKCAAVKMPEHRREAVRMYERTVQAMSTDLGRDPSDQELLQALGLRGPEVLEGIRMDAVILHPTSMDKPVEGGEDGEQASFGDLQPSKDALIEDIVTDEIMKDELAEELWTAVDELKEQQAKVLHLKYEDGLNGPEMSEEMGVSRQRVDQIEHAALQKIRTGRRGKRLKKLGEDAGLFTRAVRASGYRKWLHTGYSGPERIAIQRLEGLSGIGEEFW